MAKESKVNDKAGQDLYPLNTLYCYISGSCNLSCRHCWISPHSYEEAHSFLPIQLLKKAVHQAKPLGLGAIKLTGGEPLLHPAFREIITFINQEEINITIETNGTLIDETMADFLKAHPRLSHISVSMDGSTAKLHDYMRRKRGSFQRAREGVQHLVKSGFAPQIICTLHKNNVKDIEAVIHMAKILGCGSVKFNHVQKIGRGEDFARLHGLSVPEVITIFRQTEKLGEKVDIPIFFDIPMAFFAIKKLLRDYQKQCTILNILGILSNGDCSLCGIGESIPELIYGNINQAPLKDIWQNSPRLQQLRKLIPAQLEGICAQCIHRKLCLGACVANNYHRTRTLNSAYYFCEEADNNDLFPQSRKIDTAVDF